MHGISKPADLDGMTTHTATTWTYVHASRPGWRRQGTLSIFAVAAPGLALAVALLLQHLDVKQLVVWRRLVP